MPVAVNENSEYQRHFKWHQSKKSHSYSPPLQVVKPAAGLPSELVAKTSEPAISAKKKVLSPKTTNTTKFEIDDDEYMLLGSQDKFAPNIQYRAKSRDRAMQLWKTHKAAENGDGGDTALEAPRGPPPPPKVIYDTGAPKPKKLSYAVPAKETKSTEVRNGRPVISSEVVKKPQPVRPSGAEPVKSKSEPAIRDARVQQIKLMKENKQTVEKPKEKPVIKKPPKEQKFATGKPKDRRESRKGKLNEFAQTDLDKGVADSGQEAPAGYALMYKKGVAPPRAKGPKRLSEYAMEYSWKKGIRSSPLLAAEQLVYKNNPQAPPFRQDRMAKASEYNAQFQPWPMLMKSTPNLAQAVRNEVRVEKKSRPTKHKRSRSLEDLTPDQRPAAGGDATVSAEDKRMIKESLNPQRLHFPHGKFKRLRSEYESNFAAPQKFDYDSGAWKGAYPPHVIQREEVNSIISQEGEMPAKAWFSEVVELRKKAEDYKKRAQGTHFSREHLAQLYARQAEMWDTVSEAESVVPALSLESAATTPPPSSRASSVASKTSSTKARKSRKDAWTVKLRNDEELSSPHMGTVTPLSERTLTPDPDLYEESNDGDSCAMSAYSIDETPGRIPTPKLREKTNVKQNKTRHHLDRTTPSIGGAILTSPPQPAGYVPSEDSAPVVSKSGVVKKWATPVTPVRESFSAPGLLQPNKNQSPTYGKPTQDAHLLVDEDTASDHTLRLDFVKTQPEVDRAKKELATRLSTIKEVSGEYRSTGHPSTRANVVTLDDIKKLPVEDDALSLSVRSIASSCSLASEVLERARNRRDDFWSDKKKK